MSDELIPYQEGEPVRIKDNAFEGSDNPDDFSVRGKIGEICEIGRNGEIWVRIGDRDWPLTVDEIERIA